MQSNNVIVSLILCFIILLIHKIWLYSTTLSPSLTFKLSVLYYHPSLHQLFWYSITDKTYQIIFACSKICTQIEWYLDEWLDFYLVLHNIPVSWICLRDIWRYYHSCFWINLVNLKDYSTSIFCWNYKFVS